MKNPAAQTWVKLLCGFLTIIMAVGGVLSVLMIAILGNYNAYSGNSAENFADSFMENSIYADMQDIAMGYYRNTVYGDEGYTREKYYEEKYSDKNSNLVFTIYDEQGNVLLKNYDRIAPPVRGEVSDEFSFSITDENGEDSFYKVRIAAGVKTVMNAEDGYKAAYDFAVKAYMFKSDFIIAAVLCLVFAAAGYVFLIFQAGKNPDGTVSLRGIDKIPWDIYAAVLFLAGALSTLPLEMVRLDLSHAVLSAVLIGAYAAIIAFLLLVFLMSMATRLRVRGAIKNFAVYRLARWLWRLAVRFAKFLWQPIKSLPLIWKSGLFCIGLLILELISVSSGWVWFITNGCLVFLILAACAEHAALRAGAKAIANGEPDSRVDTEKLHGDLKAHGEDLNRIRDGIDLAVERQMKSERLKTELITNVSHDIKTPLTSIVNYVDLLKKEDLQPEKAKEYVEVLDRQTARLKKLTEDVIEASKASTGNITVNLEKTDMSVLLSQAAGEYEDKLKENNLELMLNVGEEPLYIEADGKLLWRVFDNLMGNIIKYAMPGTRVYVDAYAIGGYARASFRNISGAPLNISADELMERFVRGDDSRNTQGSGLGLSIAESLVSLQHGSFEISIDGDLFKAIVNFKISE